MIIPKNVVHWMHIDWDEPFEVVGIYLNIPNFYPTGHKTPENWNKWVFLPARKASRKELQ